MSSLDAFNDMMSQFLNELVLTFPEEKHLDEHLAKFNAKRFLDPRAPIDDFMNSVRPHSNKLMAKDDSLFDELKDLNIAKAWATGASHGTKAAIWQYLQTLYMLGTTLTMFPPETLAAIESAAKKCAESGAFDPAAIQGLLGGMGGMDSLLSGLMGGAQAPPRNRIATKKNRGKK
jgi:hypothetical protein